VQVSEILELFPFYREADPAARAEMASGAAVARVPPDAYVFRHGQACDKVVFVGLGEARVFKKGETGREVNIYRVGPGDPCILNVSCLMAGVPFPADAVVVREVEAAAVMPEVFLGWTERLPTVRDYVFEMMSSRIVSLMMQVEDLALQRVDRRLAALLLSRIQTGARTLDVTHDSIASDLGSAREVVSRLLKSLEHRGVVELGRGRVRVRVADAHSRA
jgi:CRP/FNR family transcriptional regulator